jgi:hypothetical protein
MSNSISMCNCIFRLYYVFFLVLLLFFTGCEGNRNGRYISHNAEDVVVVSNGDSMLMLDDLIDSVCYIQLETTPESLIGRIEAVKMINDKFLVWSKTSSDQIHLFDVIGRFLCSIGSYGKGPGQYVNVIDVGFNSYDRTVFLIDNGTRRVLYYDLNGEFIRGVETDFFITNMAYVAKDKIACFFHYGDPYFSGHEKSTLILFDDNFTPLDYHFIRVHNDNFSYISNYPLRNSNGKVFFNPILSASIYNINDSCISKPYEIDLKINPMPAVNEDITNEEFSRLRVNHAFFNGDFFDVNSKWLTLYFSLPTMQPSIVYDKLSKKTFHVARDFNSFSNHFYNLPWDCQNGSIVCSISAQIYLELLNSEINKYQTPDYPEIFNVSKSNLNFDDNPLLIVFSFK